MKEYLYRGLEWVSELEFIEEMSDNEFCRGVIAGIIAGVVLLLVLRFILWLCFRKKSCSQIRIDNPSGSVTVNAGAIASVLKHAAAALECLEIIRIRIFRRGRGFDIVIKAKMDPAKGTVPQLLEKLAVIVRDEMKNIFGVEDIRNVKLIIAGCPCKDDFVDDFEDDEPAEETPAGKNEDKKADESAGNEQ